mmetsp:Transcript_69489/g.126770  ORF Transcript_69489/g.126770 Transcript_69489/m.126770 type:complete len:252 (-) Transcript_69489:1537-2292(-)
MRLRALMPARTGSPPPRSSNISRKINVALKRRRWISFSTLLGCCNRLSLHSLRHLRQPPMAARTRRLPRKHLLTPRRTRRQRQQWRLRTLRRQKRMPRRTKRQPQQAKRRRSRLMLTWKRRSLNLRRRQRPAVTRQPRRRRRLRRQPPRHHRRQWQRRRPLRRPLQLLHQPRAAIRWRWTEVPKQPRQTLKVESQIRRPLRSSLPRKPPRARPARAVLQSLRQRLRRAMRGKLTRLRKRRMAPFRSRISTG